MVTTTHDLLKDRIDALNAKIALCKERLVLVRDEPAQKECPSCKTFNYHYNPRNNSWCCAYC